MALLVFLSMNLYMEDFKGQMEKDKWMIMNNFTAQETQRVIQLFNGIFIRLFLMKITPKSVKYISTAEELFIFS